MANITLHDYEKILLKIQKIINRTQGNIVQEVNKQKVAMSWGIGEVVDHHLSSNDRAQYGKKLFEQLEKDTGIIARTLYQMRSFYKTYPVLEEVQGGMSWSHYRKLIAIKDVEKRQYFEDLVVKNALGSDGLQIEIAKDKPFDVVTNAVKLTFNRGQLFTYKIASRQNGAQGLVDCGFKIFTKRKTAFKGKDGMLESVKKNGEYFLHKSQVSLKKGYTYKAYLDRVVDGDTVNVTLDLGFDIHHQEILRLAKINAPEKKTAAGIRSMEGLQKMLRNVQFLVIKTNKTDIYGRYVADVFFLEGEEDAQKVADEGVYLNQLLLDEGLAEKY